MIKRNQKLVLILVSMSMLTGMMPKTAQAANIQDLNNQKRYNEMRLDKLEGDKAETEKALKGLNEELRNLLIEQETLTQALNETEAELSSLTLQLKQLEEKIEKLNEEIDLLQSDITKTKKDIKIKEDELKLNQDYLDNRVREAYKSNTMSKILTTLLSSESIFDFYERLKFINFMAEEDKKLIKEIDEVVLDLNIRRETLYKQSRELENKRKDSEEMRDEISKVKDEVSSKKQKLEKEMKAIENLEKRRRRAYNQLSEAERVIAQKIGDIQTENEALENKIQQIILEAQRKAEEERKRKEAEQKAKEEAERVPDTSEANSQGFIRPVTGRVTSSYGYRIHPILNDRRFHTGVDYAGALGSPIKATKSGTITTSTYLGTYGNAVIIDHGNGQSSLYAHMDSFKVKVGDRVSQGQVIGTVGSTGRSTGPHLHFEIRINGKHANPANYIN